ncbi:uncharacterized protein LOC129237551 [Anastrepha obliqua]|uniref:uncharacterized protein LOC129237551 n=1 Tax=Anastrepha obliqua TaxID=95512 RepID=UPI002409B311|nr:uncharacterized protein LOC129237551 [Anastrepha obliqua]
MFLFATVFGGIAALLLFLALIIVVLRLKSKLIFGIYPSKGLFYQLKYVIALLLVKRLRHRVYHTKDDLKSPIFLSQIDRPQTLGDNPQSYDVVSFMGANEQGEKVFVSLERRRRGVLKACLYLYLPEQGLYCTPKLPDMLHFTTDGTEENDEFKGCGFHIYPEESMRQWRVRYEGELRPASDERKRLPVKLNLQFTTQAPFFHYNRDLSSAVIADSVAREAWNDAFYNLLKNVPQMVEKRIHYEQCGQLVGELHLAGRGSQLQLIGFRDHSFGTERCLEHINRYVYVAIFLADGTSMVVGNLSQPSFFLSSLKVGYVCTTKGVYEPITSCNFELYTYGEKGTPPRNKNFIVKTAKAKYFVQIEEQQSTVRYVGAEWASKVYNQFVKCTVNGIKGQGITEYLYKNKNSERPEAVSATDPEWFRRVKSFERSLSRGEVEDEDEVFFF